MIGNKKGRTITFRVDDEVAEKLEKYAKMRNTSMSRVLRNWCQASLFRRILVIRFGEKKVWANLSREKFKPIFFRHYEETNIFSRCQTL